MPRQTKIHFRNAFYHIMLRGNNRQNIFHQKDDYHALLHMLQHAIDTYDARCHLYCLMTNHIHLALEVNDVPISKIMQTITTAYAMKYNKRYDKIGHVFQGRYQSKLIHDSQYLLALCYYIHMNPVTAKMCQSPADYPWSSHHDYVTLCDRSLTSTEHITAMISDMGYSYRQFMSLYKTDGHDANYCAFDNEGALIIKCMQTKKINKPLLQLHHVPLIKIIEIVCIHMNVKSDLLCSQARMRNVVIARAMAAYFAHYHAKFTLTDVAAYFGMQRSSLSKVMHRYMKLAKSDEYLSNVLRSLEDKFAIVEVERV